MVLILDVSLEIKAHMYGVKSVICSVIQGIFQIESSRKLEFYFSKVLLSFTRAQHVLSYHLIQVPWLLLIMQKRRLKQILQLHNTRKCKQSI